MTENLEGQIPVSPFEDRGVMDVGEEGGDGSDDGDGEVLQLDELVERRGAEPDERVLHKLVDPDGRLLLKWRRTA